MDAPVLVILNQDGTPKYGLDLLVVRHNDKTDKTYIQPRTDASPSQVFQFGVAADADILPLGINTPLALKTDTGELVRITAKPGKRGENRLSTPTFVHGGQEWALSAAFNAVSQGSDGLCNLRFNGTKPGGNLEKAERVSVTADKVAV